MPKSRPGRLSSAALLDILGEAIAAVTARLGRALLVSAGTLAGVAALVATLGLASTVRSQIGAQFNAQTATEVTVRPTSGGGPGDLPTDATRLAERIRGVTAAGRYWQVNTAAQWRPIEESTANAPASLYAADPATLSVLGLHLVSGRPFTTWDDRHEIHGVLLSRSLAQQLGVHSVVPPSYAVLGTDPLLVLGIYDDARRQPETLLGAIVSVHTAEQLSGNAQPDQPSILVATRAGSAQVVADQLPVAERPDDPGALEAAAPPSSTFLRQTVDTAVSKLLVVLALVTMTIGALGIANGTLVSVLERVPEIGLRRALGARRRDIGGQFLAEGAITGTVGGLLGLSFGIAVVVIVSAASGWTPVLNLQLVALAPLAGTATGLLAAAYPAWRACTIPAAEALRR